MVDELKRCIDCWYSTKEDGIATFCNSIDSPKTGILRDVTICFDFEPENWQGEV